MTDTAEIRVRLNAQLLPGQPPITQAELEAWRALGPDVLQIVAEQLPYFDQLIAEACPPPATPEVPE